MSIGTHDEILDSNLCRTKADRELAERLKAETEPKAGTEISPEGQAVGMDPRELLPTVTWKSSATNASLYYRQFESVASIVRAVHPRRCVCAALRDRLQSAKK